MKKFSLLLLLVIVCAATLTWFVSLYLFERPVFGSHVAVRTVTSAVLKEERQYLVHLPESYSQMSAQRYPVIYVTDGSSEDMHTAASAALMARIGVIPEVIVVGIPNVSGRGRQRDYTPPGMRQDVDSSDKSEGQADAFLAFLRDELMPQVNQDYRTSDVALLAGNSRGGLFVVYALTAAPDLFDGYIANSPALWRDDGEIIRRIGQLFESQPQLSSRLFLSLGSDENEKMRGAFDHTIALLQQQAPSDFHWAAHLTPGAAHGNNAERATPVALRWLFDATWRPGSGAWQSSGPRATQPVTPATP